MRFRDSQSEQIMKRTTDRGCFPAEPSDGSRNLAEIVAADRGLRSQRRHDMVSQTLGLRSARRGPLAIAEIGR